MHYFVNIGSNLGVRALNISRAVRAIESRFGYFEISKMMESEPQGFDSVNLFSNVAEILQEIERELNPTPHRYADGSYSDRVLDIDIMAVDEMQINTPRLKVPHPRLAERKFFLQPFAELAPLWRHPATGLTCEQMLTRL